MTESNDKKPELIIFSDSFPFGVGEKPFIGPEVQYLSKHWDITIFSLASKKDRFDKSLESQLPKNVSCVWCGAQSKALQLLGSLIMPFTKTGRAELGRIRKTKHQVLARSAASAYYFGLSWSLFKKAEKLGAFLDSKEKAYYSYWFSKPAMILSLASNKYGDIKFASRIHGYDLYNERMPFGRQPFQWFKRDKCGSIFFVADYAHEYFELNYGLTKTNGEALHSSICRLGSFPPDAVAESKHENPVIVSCSNCIPLKRVDIIIRALSLVKDLNVEWVHFGDGTEKTKLEKLSQDLGIKHTFYGSVTNSAIHDFYRNNYIDLFITTSSTEGCPVSLMEAASYGIPIIGTKVGGIPELINGNGILLEESPSPESTALAIRKIITANESEIQLMREKSRNLFREKYDLSTNLKRLDHELGLLTRLENE